MNGHLQILGQDRRRFRDRRDAGQGLAARLPHYHGLHPLVLGIPRGGVVVAAEVARRMNADLDIAVARKLRAPTAPELALGAVTPDGARYVNWDIVSLLGVSDAYLERETAHQVAEARGRAQRLRGRGQPACIQGRTVILVDDGLATGATMVAAARSVQQQRPSRLVVAVPVGSAEACDMLAPETDDLICLDRPEPFGAVGSFYWDFEPVEDEEVRELLAAHAHWLQPPNGERLGPQASRRPLRPLDKMW